MFSRNQGKERTLTHRSIRLTAGAPQHLLATLPRRTQIRKTCLVNITKWQSISSFQLHMKTLLAMRHSSFFSA